MQTWRLHVSHCRSAGSRRQKWHIVIVFIAQVITSFASRAMPGLYHMKGPGQRDLSGSGPEVLGESVPAERTAQPETVSRYREGEDRSTRLTEKFTTAWAPRR